MAELKPCPFCGGVPHAEEHKKKISDGLKKYYSEHEVWNKGAKMDKGDG